jgi:5-methylcytosine-specific restriction endonuclease McrA
MTHKKIIIKKASLGRLKSVEMEVITSISSLQASYDELYVAPSELARIKQLNNERELLDKQILSIERSPHFNQKKSTLFGLLLGETELTKEGKIQIKLIEEKVEVIRKKRDLLSQKEYQNRPHIFELIKQKKDFLKKIKDQISLLENKKDKLKSLKNKATELTKKKRKLGEIIKPALPKSECPYCFAPIGSSPHADHIYPIAKGGESRVKNMVYVCKKCNLNKRDMSNRPINTV